MRSLLPTLAVSLGVLLATAGCGSSDDTSESDGDGDGGGSAKPTVEVVDSGFGQSGEYVQAMVIVTSDSPASVGEFVTVSVNFLDEAGTIVATEEQVESFTWEGQELVLPVFGDVSSVPKATIASIETSASISEHGSSAEPKEPLEPVDSTEIGSTYGTPTASFEITNPSDEDWTDLRVAVVCYDGAGKIIGGTSTYPELIAAGMTSKVDADVTTDGDPATCTAYPNYGAV